MPGGTFGIHSQLNFYGNDGVLFHIEQAYFFFVNTPVVKKSCPWFLVKTAEILHKFTDNVGFKECTVHGAILQHFGSWPAQR